MSAIEIVEVSARDGLQNDSARLSTEQKVELIARCAAVGLRRAEIASFVNPKLVPQMADGEAVVAGVRARVAGPSSWIGLVLNTRGFHRLDQSSGAVVADAQLSLNRRNGCAPRLEHERDGLVV